MTGRLIDLSHVLQPATPVYPGDQPLRVQITDSTARSTPAERHLNCSRVDVGLHCGTHMDAPLHFYGGAPSIEAAPLSCCAGRCLLFDLKHKLARDAIDAVDLQPHRERLGRIRKVVLHTGWSRRWGRPEYFAEHPWLTGAAARVLTEAGVELVGVDMPSVDLPPFDAHLELLGKGVWIVENLTNLDAIGADEFELLALPLKLAGHEASPVRAVAIVP